MNEAASPAAGPRERVVTATWEDPMPTARAAATMAGLDFLPCLVLDAKG